MKSAYGAVRTRRELTKFWLHYKWPAVGAAVLLVLALVVNVGLARYDAWVAEQSVTTLQSASLAYAEGFEAAFGARIAAITASFDWPGLAKALREGGPEAIARDVERAVGRSSAVIGARYVRAGETEIDQSTVPPLGYAALEMLRRTEETGRPAAPEVLFYGSEHAQIALLRPLTNGEQVLGHLLLALDVGLIQTALDSVGDGASPRSYVEVDQPIASGSALRLAQLGNPALRESHSQLRRPLKGAPWRVAVWSPPETAFASGVLHYAWAGLGGLAALVVAGATVSHLRRRNQGPVPHVSDDAVAHGPRGEDADDRVLARFDRARALSTPVGNDGQGGGYGAPPMRDDEPMAADTLEGLIVEESDGSEADLVPAASDILLSTATGEERSATVGPAPVPAEPKVGAERGGLPPASVFRAYDVRGVVKEGFGTAQFRDLGHAIGSEAYDRGQQTVVVGRDGRLSSPELHAAVIGGLREAGRDVIDIGLVPTPVLYFSTYYLNTGSGVMVTASHNPRDYNGLKIMLGGDTLYGDDIVALRERLQAANLRTGEGNLQEMDLVPEYIRRVSEDVPVALGNAYRLVIDCGNGAAGIVAPKLFRALGHDVIELYCNIDGSFPNHDPDTSDPANLAALAAAVVEHEADLGFGFDGDGDRLAVVDSGGNIVLPDRLMMLYARDILSRNPGSKIVYDVKCSSRLGVVISKLGGVPMMWKTGHSYLKSKLKEEGAELAGDLSGHIFFQERWYGFDDAMYAAARLLEILMAMKTPPSEVLKRLPSGVATPEIRIELPEGEHLAFMQQFVATAEIPDATVSTIDGVRADFADGWGLVRASNTTPALTLRFEAHSKEALERIQGRFKALIHGVKPGLELPF